MEDLDKDSQTPPKDKETKELEKALNSQMEKYGIAIIPCKKAENESQQEWLPEEKGKEEIKTFDKTVPRKKLRTGWMLGFLGFLGITGIVGIIKANYREAFWLVWFLWFTYFIPRKTSA